MRRLSAATGLAALLLLATSPARSQVIVHDPAAVTQLVAQAQTALSQLQNLRDQLLQAERLYESFNSASDIQALARALATEELRRFLPDADRLAAAAAGDISALGDFAERALEIRQAARLHAPSDPTQAEEALEAAGLRTARDLALAERVDALAQRRRSGLDDLQTALGQAASARAILDISARTAIEQAIIANDQVRLQGLAMLQAAESRAQVQRQEETAARTHVQLMATFQRGFHRP